LETGGANIVDDWILSKQKSGHAHRRFVLQSIPDFLLLAPNRKWPTMSIFYHATVDFLSAGR
jgi:hypothetical protein